ncbi:MAG: hypothetical protein ABL901_00675 [Hyphomicrobiaceae bacterium]
MSRDYGRKLEARRNAEALFPQAQKFKVEKKPPSRALPAPPARFSARSARQIMMAIGELDDKKSAYVRGFGVPGVSAAELDAHLRFLIQQGYVEVASSPVGAAFDAFKLTDKGAEYIWPFYGDTW